MTPLRRRLDRLEGAANPSGAAWTPRRATCVDRAVSCTRKAGPLRPPLPPSGSPARRSLANTPALYPPTRGPIQDEHALIFLIE